MQKACDSKIKEIDKMRKLLVVDLKLRFQEVKARLATHERDHFTRGIDWVKSHRLPGGGIAVHHKSNVVTQEVSGYIIQTLYNAGEKEFAYDLARWEASIQRPDGSFTAPDGVPYTFDTAQVIRGFLAVLDDLPHLANNLTRACDYVEHQITEDGRVRNLSYDAWKTWDGDVFTEYTNLYVLPPLFQAGQKLGKEKYVKASLRGMDYFRRKKDLVEFKSRSTTISHIFGYIMEALVELDETELAKEGLRQVVKIQRKDGAIPAYPGVNWVCSTGMAQLAVAFYRLGYRQPADKAVDYLEKIQNPSGGFFGSYGKGAKYFPREEISWAVKFFLDAYMLKLNQNLTEK
jgi:malonyl-CoA O-methyltransferase